MHEVLVNRLGGLSLPRKSVVRLTDRPDMTLDVYRGHKTTIQPTTDTSLITEAEIITESDQAVRAVHSCNSWFLSFSFDKALENCWKN